MGHRLCDIRRIRVMDGHSLGNREVTGMSGKRFTDMLWDIRTACVNVEEAGKCQDECPIKHNCIRDTVVDEWLDFVQGDQVDELLKKGDKYA